MIPALTFNAVDDIDLDLMIDGLNESTHTISARITKPKPIILLRLIVGNGIFEVRYFYGQIKAIWP